MHIAVCIKQVPDSDELTTDAETGRLKRGEARAILNPYDAHALEMAFELKERHGGHVTVITMGPPNAEAALRSALARGADDGLLLTDSAFGGSDTWATARVLSRAIEKLEGVDLLLFGRQATDGDTGQVGPGVAGFLDWPVLTDTVSVEPAGKGFSVVRASGAGDETWSMDAPCALTVLKEANTPCTLRRNEDDHEITIWGLAELGLAAEEVGLQGSPTRVQRIFAPPADAEPIRFMGEPDEMVAGLVQTLEARNLL